ncbi:beta-lactamase/transpeptidase-like protein [Lyophyllum atratum]|nr:beta-lactamase/transpeptidase-like protein [Lyophyllum atratum]
MRLEALLSSLIVPCLLYASSPAFGQGTQNKPVLNNATDAFINDLLAEWKSPGGVAISIVRKDDMAAWTVETKGYGVAILANGSRVTENTLFAIGSNSKLFNAIATGLLVSNETLSPRLLWTSKLASIVPGWGLVDTIAAKQATIIDALSHRIGLPRHDFSYRWTDDIPTLIKKMNFQRPSAEFRDVYQYTNNPPNGVLSYLPTLLLPSKIPFARYVKQHIFEPLSLTSTTYSYDVAKSGHLADGMVRQGANYSENPLGGTPKALPFWSTTGGEDGNMLLLGGYKPGTNQSVIPPEVIEKVSTGVSVAFPIAGLPELSPVVYGGGQARSTYRGHEVVEHDGGTPGFYSQITRLPFDDLGIAVLCNDFSYGSYLMQIIKFRLIDEALNLEPVDWDARYKSILSVLPPVATPRPSNATDASANFTFLAGVYKSDAYGDVELCLVSVEHLAASSSCKALAANLSTILPGAVDPEIPTFIGVWDSPWMSHIKLSHFGVNHFNVSALRSYPQDNASEPYWVFGGETTFTSPASAEIVVDGRQIGLSLNGMWGAGDGIASPQRQTVRDRAEIWFNKA